MIIICPRFCLSTQQGGGVENNFGLEIAYTLGSTTTIPGDIYIVNNWLNVPSYWPERPWQILFSPKISIPPSAGLWGQTVLRFIPPLQPKYHLPTSQKLQLYREKAELWFTNPPRLLVTHGNQLRNSPSQSSDSCLKSKYFGVEWALLQKSAGFQFPSRPQKCTWTVLLLQENRDLGITFFLSMCYRNVFCSITHREA